MNRSLRRENQPDSLVPTTARNLFDEFEVDIEHMRRDIGDDMELYRSISPGEFYMNIHQYDNEMLTSMAMTILKRMSFFYHGRLNKTEGMARLLENFDDGFYFPKANFNLLVKFKRKYGAPPTAYDLKHVITRSLYYYPVLYPEGKPNRDASLDRDAFYNFIHMILVAAQGAVPALYEPFIEMLYKIKHRM